uniref:Uncharacterized protein n=1 Tax=Leersia perrieri TaxID=77586 RepID=A0A0D9WFK9_9ORYZ
MGKKRGSAAAPVFPFRSDDEPRRFTDYGFDAYDPRPSHVRNGRPAQRFFSSSQATAKRPAAAAALDSARFKLQKPIISKKQRRQHQRRRWWSSAASAALFFLFNRGSSSSSSSAAASSVVDTSSYRSMSKVSTSAGPLYLAAGDEDEDDDGAAAAACACWAAPAMRSGHLAASELGASASVLPYVSLRDGRAAAGEAPPPAMPIYLVT